MRRAAAQGTLRCERPGPRRLRFDPGEQEYLREHWPLLSELRRILRTKRRVRFAALYGSTARGDEDSDSDLDVLVMLNDDQPMAAVRLAGELEDEAGRRVDVARLPQVESTAPLLLDRVLDEGRVLVDRAEVWRSLQERRRAIRARAKRAHSRRMYEAGVAIGELVA